MKFKTYLHDVSGKSSLDSKIPYNIIASINDIGNISVLSTCDGHQKEGPSIIFKLTHKKYKMLTFCKLKPKFDEFQKNLQNILEKSIVEGQCGYTPSDFLYDSINGYNKDILKKYDMKFLNDSLCYQFTIKIKSNKLLDDQDTGWKHIYTVLLQMS